MAQRRSTAAARYLVVRSDQPLIAIPIEEDGQDLTYYFADEKTAHAVLGEGGVQRALSLAGAWSDLDWEEMRSELDRIRHQTPPTPPIDDL